MNKRFITLFFLLISHRIILAQEIIVKFCPIPDTTNSRNFYFVEVVDNRVQVLEKNEIGELGNGKRKTSVLLDSTPEICVLTYLDQLCPKRENDTIPLILRINHIECTSKVGWSVEAKTSMNVDIIKSITGEVITNLSIEKNKKVPIITGRTFGKLIEEILHDCFIEIGVLK